MFMKKIYLLLISCLVSTCISNAQLKENKFPTFTGSYQIIHVNLNQLDANIHFTENELELSVLAIENIVEVDFIPSTMTLNVKGLKPRIIDVKSKVVAFGLEITSYTEE